MRKVSILLGMLTLFFIMGAGCDSSSQTAMETYTNKDNNFSIQHPTNWTTKEGVAGAVVAFLAPSGMNDSFNNNLIVIVKSTSANVDDYVQSALQKAPKEYTDFKLVDNKATAVNSEKARMITYSFTENADLKPYSREVFVVKNGKVYDILFTTIQADPDKDWDTAQKMIDSFKFIQ